MPKITIEVTDEQLAELESLRKIRAKNTGIISIGLVASDFLSHGLSIHKGQEERRRHRIEDWIASLDDLYRKIKESNDAEGDPEEAACLPALKLGISQLKQGRFPVAWEEWLFQIWDELGLLAEKDWHQERLYDLVGWIWTAGDEKLAQEGKV
jgi:hypothetical protein